MDIFKKFSAFLSFLGFYRSISLKESRKDIIFIIFLSIITVAIFFIPTGFEDSGVQSNAERHKVRITYVDKNICRR